MTVYARYSDPNYKYGNTSRLYGLPATFDDQLHWGIDIDWRGDGYTGFNEAQYCTGLETKRGRNNFINIGSDGSATGFEPVRVGTCTITLDNTSGRYDPYNASSPIYPYVLPGRFVRVRVMYKADTYNVFTGKIKNITLRDDGTVREARIECEDGWRLLQSADTAVYDPFGGSDAASNIGRILDDIEFPARYGRNLQYFASYVPLNLGLLNGKAASEAQKITDAVLGYLFIANNGSVSFFGYNQNTTPVLSISSSDLLKTISQPNPWEVVRNNISIARYSFENNTNELWNVNTGGAPVILPASGSLDLWVNYSVAGKSVIGYSVLPPAAGVNYQFKDSATLTIDYTSFVDVNFVNFGKTGKYTFKNNTAVELRANILFIFGDWQYVSSKDSFINNDTTSQKNYGIATLKIDNSYLYYNNVQPIATQLLAFLEDPKPFLTVQMEARPDIQFTPDLFDVVSATIDKMNINQNFRVGNIEHRWLSPNGQAVGTIMQLESYL